MRDPVRDQFNHRAILGYAGLIAVGSAAAFGLSWTWHTTYLQWGMYCVQTDLFPRDYLVGYFRDQARPACAYYHLVGRLVTIPAVTTAAALTARAGIAATMLLLFRALFRSQLVAVLSTLLLVATLAQWPGVSSIEATGQLAFSPRPIATALIVGGFCLATRGRAVLAGIAFGIAVYLQALNALLAAAVTAIFLVIGAAADRSRAAVQRALAFSVILVLAIAPYLAAAGSNRVIDGGPSLKSWAAARFLNEPDDASLLYSARMLWPEWYVVQALGFAALLWITRRRLATESALLVWRWVVAVWTILLVGGICEAFYGHLPDYPFVWLLQFEFRRAVWMSGLFLIPPIIWVLVELARESRTRAVGSAGLGAALALRFTRFSGFALCGGLAITMVPGLLAPARAGAGRWRNLVVRAAIVFAALAAPRVILAINAAVPSTEAWLPVVLLSRILGALPAPVRLLLGVAAILAPELASVGPVPFGARRRWLAASILLATYTVSFFGHVARTNAEGLFKFRQSWPGLTSTKPMTLSEWQRFLRRYDYYFVANIAAGVFDPSPAERLEEASAAIRRTTPRDALLLVPPDLGLMRGLTERSVLFLEDEDSAWGHYNRAVWVEFTTRFRTALGVDFVDFKRRQRDPSGHAPGLRDLYLTLGADQARMLVRTYGVTHMLTEARHVLPFPVLFQNTEYVVYDLDQNPALVVQ